MGYGVLVVGVALWWLPHFFKRMAPARRAAMGDTARGIVALALLVSVVLMVIGFRAAPADDLWFPPASMRHLNNLLVLVGIWMMSPAGQKGLILNKVRHPMLIGFSLWATAHLLVNGDLASIILFGGLLAWALAEIAVINRAEPSWTPGQPGTLARDAMFFVASLVLLAVIGQVHAWLGHPVFG